MPSTPSSSRLLSSATPFIVAKSNSSVIYENLAVEAALMRGLVLQKNEGVLFFYIDSPCVVVGRNQNILQEVSMRRAVRDRVRVARRASGGGTVFHDGGNVCLSFISCRDDYAPEKTVQLLRSALSVGFHVAPHRLTTTSRHDLFLDGQKITGSAMRVQRDMAYHHCTLLLSSSRQMLGRYLQPEHDTYFFHTAAVSSVRSPVTTLQHALWSNKDGVTDSTDERIKKQREYLVDPSNFMRFMGLFYSRFAGCKEVLAGDMENISSHPLFTSFFEEWAAREESLKVAEPSSSHALSRSIFYELDVLQGMKERFRFIDGEGRRPVAEEGETLPAEVARTASLDWLWNMPKFESVVALTREELREGLLALLSPSAAAAWWNPHQCEGMEEDEVQLDVVLDELIESVLLPAASAESVGEGETVLFVKSVVSQRVVQEIEIFSGALSAAEIKPERKEVDTTTTSPSAKSTAKPTFDTSTLHSSMILTGLVEACTKGQLVDKEENIASQKDYDALAAVLRPLVASSLFDLPEAYQLPCAVALISSILRIWRRKNNFDFMTSLEVKEELNKKVIGSIN